MAHCWRLENRRLNTQSMWAQNACICGYRKKERNKQWLRRVKKWRGSLELGPQRGLGALASHSSACLSSIQLCWPHLRLRVPASGRNPFLFGNNTPLWKKLNNLADWISKFGGGAAL